MSLSVSRESISKLMTELAESFPMEGESRASISDFGKLLFAEGQGAASVASASASASGSSAAVKQEPRSAGVRSDESKEQDDDDDEDDQEGDGDEEENDDVDNEPTPQVGQSTAGTKRVFTEIKGVPRQKHHDVQCVVTETGKIAIAPSSMQKLMKTKEKAVPKRWTQEEDDMLRAAVAKHGERNWKAIAEEVPGRNHTQCLQRWTKVLAPGLVKGHWRPEEDELLKELVAEGRKNWGQVANRIPGRTSKQCRERWYNHLDPSIVRGEYTAEEDRIIIEAQARLGNKWSTIAAMLPGRTEDAVKIRWKSLCRVRKGQNRRQGEKGKQVAVKQMPSGFNGSIVKSEELGSFTAIQTQATPMGRVPVVQPPMMGPTPLPMGAMASTMMYAPSATGYNPAGMAGYPKPHVVMHPAASYGPGGTTYRPMYAANVSSFNVMGASTSTDPSSNVYGHSNVPTYVTPSGTLYRAQGSAPASSHVGPGMVQPGYGYGMPANSGPGGYQPPPYPQSVSSQAHGGQFAPSGHYPPQQQTSAMGGESSAGGHAGSTSSQRQHEGQPTNDQPPRPQGLSTSMQQSHGSVSSNGGGSFAASGGKSVNPSPAAAFAQRLSTPKGGNMGNNNPSPAARFASSLSANGSANPTFSQHRQPEATSANPATMFAQKLAANSSTPTTGAGVHNPVAAFLQKQQQQQQQEGANPGDPTSRPFNPAAAFAQRLQPAATAPKPPIPVSSASSGKSADDSASVDEEDGDEPSLKKVKPRNSIDMAARASAARRLRNSGSGNALMGRRSLDVFLNEIGDVGRISDLKMDEFQTLDELWRVSGDMDRLSL
ncbi:hypothetical protein PINS_up017003 [Pythium insidiosum]|nr:hypothetical protein PINS_up017003 [Pythium insidiosum]